LYFDYEGYYHVDHTAHQFFVRLVHESQKKYENLPNLVDLKRVFLFLFDFVVSKMKFQKYSHLKLLEVDFVHVL